MSTDVLSAIQAVSCGVLCVSVPMAYGMFRLMLWMMQRNERGEGT